MQEPEIRGARAELAPMRERGLEQDIGTNNIGVDEIGGPIDRSIDMTFRRQMHDRVGVKTRKNVGDGRTIADIGEAEMITRMALHRSERGKIAGISQLVDDEHLVVGVSDKISHQCRPDEARSTSDNDLHASIHLVSCVRGAGSPSLARLSAHAWHLKAASPCYPMGDGQGVKYLDRLAEG